MDVWSPYIQFGFAGFCFLLMGIIVWLIRQLIRVQRESAETNHQLGDVIHDNSDAIRSVYGLVGDQLKLLRQIHDRLLARPCLLPDELQRVVREALEAARRQEAGP